MTVHVGLLGCGRIAPKHIEAISQTESVLEAVCDINMYKAQTYGIENDVPHFYDYSEMLEHLRRVGKGKNMVTIATPNHLHFQQALDCLKAGQHILLEKPACLTSVEVEKLISVSKEMKRNAYCVLQVRHNPSVVAVKEALPHLGKLRSFSLVQRWQRPLSYYENWYGQEKLSGGVLFEVGIHYLDILCHLIGRPVASSTRVYSLKGERDTVHSLVSLGGIPGTVEVTTGAEPHNLECSISLLGDLGYIKLGGIALDRIEHAEFYDGHVINISGGLSPNEYGDHKGSCPNHPQVYEDIAKSKGLKLEESLPVIKFIEDIYAKTGKN